jgi:hypothetical protein
LRNLILLQEQREEKNGRLEKGKKKNGVPKIKSVKQISRRDFEKGVLQERERERETKT